MSGTLGTSRNRVRVLIHDTLTGNLAVSDERLNQMIDSANLQVGNVLGYSDTWLTSAVTLVAGTTEYSFTAGEYQTLTILRRASDKRMLRKQTMRDLEALRDGAATDTRGSVTDYALYETTGQLIKLRVYPTPSAADTLDAFVSTTVTALSADSDAIPHSRGGVQALEYMVAAECVGSMTPEDLMDRHLSPATAAIYAKRSADLLAMEKERRTSERRLDAPRRVWI